MMHHLIDLIVAVIALFWVLRAGYWRKKYEAEKSAKEQRDNWIKLRAQR